MNKKKDIVKVEKKEKDVAIPITNSDYAELGIVDSSGKVEKI